MILRVHIHPNIPTSMLEPLVKPNRAMGRTRNPGRTNVSDWHADANARYGRDKSA